MSLPKCPHCEHVFSVEEIYYTGSTDFPKESDGDVTHTKCSNCQHPLTIELSLEPAWRFFDENDCEITT